MIKLSAVIITLNEEKYIGQCLKSLSGIADEIIVVDSFSTDRTEEICREHGAVFAKNKFIGYRDQKNHAVSLATNDYILSLDADEEVSPLLRESILTFIGNPDGIDYCTVNRFNRCAGRWIKHAGLYPDRKIRLFNRKKGRWSGFNVHELVTVDSSARGIHLNGDLLHYVYDTFDEYLLKTERYAVYSANEYYKKGVRACLLTPFLHAAWRFAYNWVVRGGFLEGYHGFMICKLNARYVYLKYRHLRDLNRIDKKSGK
jgi:glycosyltransferase involved in cell wall biosynthesis